MPPLRPALLLALIALTGSLAPRGAHACDRPDCAGEQARETADSQRVPPPCDRPDCGERRRAADSHRVPPPCDRPDCEREQARETADSQRVPLPCNEPDCDKE